MLNTTIVFSINVHEKKEFLIKQLENIKNHVLLDYVIIINPNDFMYKKISESNIIKSQKNIILNPNYLNKKWNHGSLTKGIYLNMKYALDNYEFKYFIILSSRNLFYNKLTEENLNHLVKNDPGTKINNLAKKKMVS